MPPGLWVTRILILADTLAKTESDQHPGKEYHSGRWGPGTRPIGLQLSPILGMSNQPATHSSIIPQRTQMPGHLNGNAAGLMWQPPVNPMSVHLQS